MNIFSFSDEILKKINQRKNIYIERTINGSVQSFEDYRFLVGKITSCEEIQSLIKEYIKSLEK